MWVEVQQYGMASFTGGPSKLKWFNCCEGTTNVLDSSAELGCARLGWHQNLQEGKVHETTVASWCCPSWTYCTPVQCIM
jgi:hypothetical protein